MGSSARPRSTARRRPKSRLRSIAPLLAGFLLAIVGWIVWSGLRGPQARELQPAAATPGVMEGELAPNFTVPTLGGGTFNLAEQRGKPTVLFFMAYWCGTCIPEARALARLHEDHGDALTIVALDIDPSSSEEALAQFKAAVGDPAYLWAFDPGQVVAMEYKIFSLDATVVLDAAGRVAYRDNFPTPYENLKDVVAPLLGAGTN